MSLNTNSNALAEKLQSRDATREPAWVRYTLLTIALIFFLSCLLLPLILVYFSEYLILRDVKPIIRAFLRVTANRRGTLLPLQ